MSIASIARMVAAKEGVAVCERCFAPHHEATAGAPWRCLPRCRNCGGRLVFPDPHQESDPGRLPRAD